MSSVSGSKFVCMANSTSLSSWYSANGITTPVTSLSGSGAGYQDQQHTNQHHLGVHYQKHLEWPALGELQFLRQPEDQSCRGVLLCSVETE